MEDLVLNFLYQNRTYAQQFFNGTGVSEQFIQFAKTKGHDLDSQKDSTCFREAFWRLVGKGLVAPGTSANGGMDKLPWISITEYGIKCIEEGKIEIYDPRGFINSLKKRILNLDPIVEMYINEALGSFAAHRYLASMVMIGGALEKTTLDLTTTFGEVLDGEEKDAYTKNVLSCEKIKTRLEKFLDHLEVRSYKKHLDRPTKEKLESSLPAIANIVRIARNEVGHPTGRSIEQEEAEANLLLAREGIVFSAELLSKLLKKS
jgi:hypothetical protein